jgi:5-methylcytosine-specific restriction endonuclease McrA
LSDFRKRPRELLDAEAYKQLRFKVLERDGWRCQICGRRTLLDVHHIDFRACGGDDSDTNLMTLCRVCHQRKHALTGTRQT